MTDKPMPLSQSVRENLELLFYVLGDTEYAPRIIVDAMSDAIRIMLKDDDSHYHSWVNPYLETVYSNSSPNETTGVVITQARKVFGEDMFNVMIKESNRQRAIYRAESFVTAAQKAMVDNKLPDVLKIIQRLVFLDEGNDDDEYENVDHLLSRMSQLIYECPKELILAVLEVIYPHREELKQYKTFLQAIKSNYPFSEEFNHYG